MAQSAVRTKAEDLATIGAVSGIFDVAVCSVLTQKMAGREAIAVYGV